MEGSKPALPVVVKRREHRMAMANIDEASTAREVGAGHGMG